MEREVKRAVLIRIGPVCSVVFASLRNYPCSVFVSHEMYRCILPRDLLISSSGDSLETRTPRSLTFQASPPFFASCSRVDRPRRRGGGGRGSGEWGGVKIRADLP